MYDPNPTQEEYDSLRRRLQGVGVKATLLLLATIGIQGCSSFWFLAGMPQTSGVLVLFIIVIVIAMLILVPASIAKEKAKQKREAEEDEIRKHTLRKIRKNKKSKK